ncbi:MAG: DUF4836 family protein [Flavipsychrobacter sp.]|nr:DUF4836 family protein [Flavipsychrobacter sp.]
MNHRIALVLFIVICFLSACNKTPEHVNYIPKDASLVIGVNTAGLGKKIAWDALWGSKLLEEMQERMDKKDVMKDMGNSGIKAMATYYLYLKTDKRFDGGNKVTAVLPVDDVAKWEAYLKKVAPEAVIKTQKERKEALLTDGMYAGWTKDVLIIMNTIYPSMEGVYEQLGNATAENYDSLVNELTKMRKPDEALMAIEMDKAFTKSSENAVSAKESFMKLEKEGHDITMWLNYETLSGDYMNPAMTGGLALSSTLWKDAAMAAGFDFEDGKIAGQMKYYMSKELQTVFKDFGNKNVDKELIDRLPAERLNMLTACYIAPESMKAMVDKLGVTGMLNAGLMETGLTADDIFTAFSGDFALTLNDFKVSSVTVPTDSLYEGQKAFTTNDADIQYTVAIKTGKKESFDKLLQFATKNGLLVADATGKGYIIKSRNEATNILIDKGYCVVSNNKTYADGFMNGSYKNAKKPANTTEVSKHPWGFYFDVKSMFANVNVENAASDKEKAMLEMSKNLLDDVTASGAENKGDIFEYNISVNFSNKEENSLIQLLNYASKLAELNKQEQAITAR